MKVAFEALSIVLFFIAYKLYGLFVAVAVAMGCYAVSFAVQWARTKTVDKTQLIMMGMILILGGSTLLFHNEQIFKWKPTVVYVLFAAICLASHFMGKKRAIQHLLEKNLHLPDRIWKQLNLSWCVFFLFLAVCNLWVAYCFDTDTWVNFKLFGILILCFIFVILQACYLARYKEKYPHDSIEPSSDHHQRNSSSLSRPAAKRTDYQ